jgi:hypothetical protein
MLIAADYPLLEIIWTMLVFFGWVIWFWLLIRILSDVFRRHDTSGWVKAGWIILAILLPFVGVLAYLIVNGKGMAERDQRDARAANASFDDYVKSVAASEGPTAEIERAKQLLDSGAITQTEFDSLKAKALVT